MNRLILVGNGFDLAHGMKTSYVDFISWYLERVITTTCTEEKYDDGLLSVRVALSHSLENQNDSIKALLRDCFAGHMAKILSNHPVPGRTNQDLNLNFRIKNDWFKDLLISCSGKRWVDIEHEYFTTLTSILTTNILKKPRQQQLVEHNTALKEIIRLLGIYLLQLPKPPVLDSVSRMLNSNVYQRAIPEADFEDEKPFSTMILNFNYTDTFKQYKDQFSQTSKSNLTLNYIHGRISANHVISPLVFGYGDELDTNYSKMLDQGELGYLEHIKTFWYPKTSNYQNLVGFIEAGKYEVVVLGLSCGLSDRTLLHMIFEHDNCSFIKLYHYNIPNGENSFQTLLYAVARHFKSPEKLRNRIVPFDSKFQIS